MAISVQTEEKPGWQRPFFMMWSSQALSLLGSTLVQFALVWWMTNTTGSAAVLATATIVGMLPEIVLGPFAGALVDRWKRKTVMIVSDSCVALATVALIILFWQGVIQPWHIYVALFIRSLAGCFQFPAMHASTSLMVPDSQLARIAGLNGALQGIMSIAGPPLGALLLSLMPMHTVLSVDVATAAMAVTVLLFTLIPQPAGLRAVQKVTPKLVWTDFREGLRFSLAWPALMAFVLMATVMNFLANPPLYMSPLLITTYFHKDAWLLGAVQSALGVGFLLGGLVLGAWGGMKNRVLMGIIFFVGSAISVLAMGYIPVQAYYLLIVAFFTLGVFMTLSNSSIHAVFQSKIPNAIQGRTFSLMNSLAKLTTPLSVALAAPLVEKFGIIFLFRISGFLTVAFQLIALSLPIIRNFEKMPVPEMSLDQTAGD